MPSRVFQVPAWLLLLRLGADAAQAGPAAVVLLGPSGSGKSETGNTLLGQQLFKVSGGLESETLLPQAHVANFEGRAWQVVDTPGYFDTSRSPEELAAALEKFSEIVGGHIAALAFVVPYGRFGDAHLRAWRLLRGSFGQAALAHTVLAFSACGSKTEEDVLAETVRLCGRDSPPVLCSVLEELSDDRLVTFGALDVERRERDRSRFFALASALESSAGGRGYDHRDFLRSQARRRLIAERIGSVSSQEDRRMLELMLAGVEAGASDDEELLRRLEEAEGIGVSERVFFDFEDRSLEPFAQVGNGWKRPMPVPYTSMHGSSVDDGSGGILFLHTGSDSGVRIRHGEKRRGELRSAPFLLGRGEIAWRGAGAGGYIAVCPADAGDDASSCVLRRFRQQSAVLVRDQFAEEELLGLVGSLVYLRLVDDQIKGWGFVALDNLEYPVVDTAAGNGTEAELPVSEHAALGPASPGHSPTGGTQESLGSESASAAAPPLEGSEAQSDDASLAQAAS